MQSERAKSLPPLLEPLRSLPLVLTCLFVAVAAVDAVLALQPALLTGLRSQWQHALPSGESPWPTLAAAAVIVGATALAASILAGFVRAVRAAPYPTLGPVWVGSCMLVIGRLQFELPLPVPTPAFVACSALLFLGGGALFERRALFWNVIGGVFSLLPPLLLGLGYALVPSATLDSTAILLLTVVVLASAGAPIIALAARAHGARLDPASEAAYELTRQLREVEDRALSAERQLATLPAWSPANGAGPRLMLEADELTPALRASSGGSARWIAPLLIALAVFAAAGAYALVYLPLRDQLAAQLRHNAQLSAAQAAALASVRADYEREKRALEQQLSAAQANTTPAAPPEQLAAAAAVPGDPAAERHAARIAKHEAALAAREQRAAERAAREQRAAEHKAEGEQRASEQRTADVPSSGEQSAAHEPGAADAPTSAAKPSAREQRAAERRAAREQRLAAHLLGQPVDGEATPKPAAAAPSRDAVDSTNDDPLEGLDNL